MNRTWKVAVRITVLMLTTSLGQPAVAVGGDPGKIIDQLLDLSGTSDMVGSLPAMVDQQMATQVGKLEGEDGAFFQETLRAAFDPAPIRASIVASLRENFDDARAESALEWYQSDLGSKVRAEETRAQSPEAQQEMLSYAQGFQTTPPDPERLELAQRLDAGSQSTALSLRLIMELMRGMMGGLVAMAPADEQPPTAEEIEELLGQQMAQMGQIVQSQTLVSILFSGRNLSVDEIRSYLAYVESDSGQWFHQQTGTGLVNAMARAGKAFGNHMAAWMQEKKFSITGEEAEKLRETAMVEGQAFGKNTTQTDCTNEAFERRNACRDFMCFARSRLFLEGCLDTSKREASLCIGAPSVDDLMATIYWRLERCEQRGTTTSACTGLMGTIQDYCASPRTSL